MKNNLFKRLYKQKKSPTKAVSNTKSSERKGLSNRATTLITAATTILNIFISSFCILYSVHVQKVSNSFNLKATEYVRRQKIADLILEEAGESESYLHDKWECSRNCVNP